MTAVNTELLKLAARILHQHIRGQERLNLSPESIDKIQKDTDKMWYSHGRAKLNGSNYYSPLRDPQQNLIGYAAFQAVGKNPYSKRLILTTILSKSMKPRGDNIGAFFDLKVPGTYPSDPNAPKPFKGMRAIPDAKKN